MPRIALLCLTAVLACASHASELRRGSGASAPALELNDLTGNVHRLADYRGRVVLINFWATWCEPCRDEMPSIERLRAKLAGRPFTVLAVNVDEPQSRIRTFLARLPLGFPVLLDPGRRATRAWSVRVLPASFVVGPDGRVRYAAVGELDWSAPPAVERITALLPAR